MSKRNLGDMGENTLKLWASQTDISVNKASPDKTGWDFLVEFPQTYEASTDITLPLDREPSPVQCLVQVKSTDKRPGKRSVKLSNWMRLVNNPLPAFFLVLEFDFQNTCQRGYLVHVDEGYIRSVLRRLRELPPEKRSKLHKTTLQFKYDEINRLPSLDGAGLEHAIRRCIGDDLLEYANKKLEMLRTVGYEEGRWELAFAMPPPPDSIDVQEHLVNFALGLIPHLKTTRVEVKDVRFGIAAPEPINVFEQAGILEIVDRKSVGNGTIVLRGGDRELRLNTEVYLPQGLGFDLDKKYVKACFAVPFVDLILWLYQSNKCDLKLELPHPSTKHQLKRLHLVSELVLMLHEAHAQSSAIGFKVRFNSSHLGSGYISVGKAIEDHIVNQATAISRAWTIAKHFDVHDNVELRTVELLRQQERLMLVSSVLEPTQPSARIIGECERTLADDGEQMCVPYATDVIVGQYRIAVSIAIIGNSEPTGRIGDQGAEFKIETNDIRLCRKHIYDREEEPVHSLQDLAASVVEEYKDSTSILALEGINSHLLAPEDTPKCAA